ncbi:outer membrane protein assembly factor BamE domain-containing protein [Franzmannia qiaohouensis]|uniref:Outer membrane protein assembly factor BamE n=1 Tax=Franzmannia qiaohouensis TaxID=1329370 RepID=A0ABU1H9K8_9GAMM|nr:outer membrane protein assembly factor BamE [Halomonas qiaohouensis]MDR5903698.1 outer membrane protein assembly factor BamE [Halomonas qiaohouensis]
MQKLIKTVTLSVALTTLVSGCSYLGVYKRDLAQGNLVTQDMVGQLQPGMSRDQVRGVMGTPLLEGPFDASQWDYLFRLDEAYGGVDQRRVTLTFDGDRLVDISRDGDLSRDIDLMPEDGPGPAPEGVGPDDGMSPQPEAQPEPQQGGGTAPAGGAPAERAPEPSQPEPSEQEPIQQDPSL